MIEHISQQFEQIGNFDQIIFSDYIKINKLNVEVFPKNKFINFMNSPDLSITNEKLSYSLN